jgi:hypothetical protein
LIEFAVEGALSGAYSHPKELASRANAALNLFHIGGAFVVQYMTGLVVQLWAPVDGNYPLGPSGNRASRLPEQQTKPVFLPTGS